MTTSPRPTKFEIADAVQFTHFVDLKDGAGGYRDYKRLSTVLRKHSEACRDKRTARSWIKGYDDTGTLAIMVADWMPGQKIYAQAKRRVA